MGGGRGTRGRGVEGWVLGRGEGEGYVGRGGGRG